HVRHHDEAATWIARMCGDNAFDLILAVNWSRTHLDGKGGCGSLNRGHEGLEQHGCCWIEQQRHTHGARSHLLYYFHPFSAQSAIHAARHEAGDVTARMGKVRNEAAGIGYARKHERNCPRLVG